MTDKLFTQGRLGEVDLKNRVVMAPMTRNRAQDGTDAPYDIHVEYYRQRAGAGLIITEATQITPEGKGYIKTPGIHSDEQVEGWRKVVEAVQEEGGRIALQLWHVGRISHVSLQPDGQQPVAPSAIRAEAQTFTENGFEATSEPRALGLEEMPRMVEDWRRAAENAKRAGFDMVEIHAANGYLLDQFLRDGANKRDDAYGGSPENRSRLVLEIVDAVAEVMGAGRTGIRLSPLVEVADLKDSDPLATYGHLIPELSRRGLAYLHMVEPGTRGDLSTEGGQTTKLLRELFEGAYIANAGYDRESGIRVVEQGQADFVAYGRPYIGNPDLERRLELNEQIAESDQSSWYGGGLEGYIDYPTLWEQKAA
ncbi:alkene reductase [Limimaricola pyoseonensis]|uniref:N-ethylmaleimide reductase n=1 Tax=Limimaricola pyoseonensis TaxID=521013 RepID=A0A1G7H1M8_9RHOB|nr:alkene reductase [Limimaricola pyoseonensis]SDE94328.1 N-ethylmaleimide reductase [Limimaricola pyoseonensis]